ncbi:MAG: PD40 domain-containing protein [Chitinophagales bacterium]|nr:PD40 domain-containing protein [Chitinophagales bacterium]
MILQRTIFLSFFLLVSVSVAAQKQFINAADKLFEAQVYDEAAQMYSVLLQENYSYEANVKVAECFMRMNMPMEAEYWYGQLVKQNRNDAELLLRYANLLKTNGKYTSAKNIYLEYAQFNQDGFYLAGTCDFAMNNLTDDGLVALDTVAVNTVGSDIAPSFFGGGIMYASAGVGASDAGNKAGSGMSYYDLYYAELIGNKFSTPNKLNGNINSNLHEASCSYDDARNELYFTRNKFLWGREKTSSDKNVKLSIYVAEYNGGKWQPISEFAYNPKNYSAGQPFITTDGDILLFVSDMAGGYGGTDIYFSMRVNNEWSSPKNMGEAINTKGNEMYPFLSEEGKLYFASDWHAGYGGLDIFISERESDHWKKPTNLGLPVNSSRDDFGYIVQAGNGYFTSNRSGGKGYDDIYAFTILKPVESLRVTSTDGIPVAFAKIKLMESNQPVNAGETDVNGFVQIKLEANKKYSLHILKEGFMQKNIPNIEAIRTSTGLLPVELQALMGEKEKVPKKDIETPEKDIKTPEIEKVDTRTADIDTSFNEVQVSNANGPAVYTYDVQIGIFKTPDYTKLAALTTAGELSVKSQEDGRLSFSIINLQTKADADKVKKMAHDKGFKDAVIIIYKNGVKQ